MCNPAPRICTARKAGGLAMAAWSKNSVTLVSCWCNTSCEQRCTWDCRSSLSIGTPGLGRAQTHWLRLMPRLAAPKAARPTCFPRWRSRAVHSMGCAPPSAWWGRYCGRANRPAAQCAPGGGAPARRRRGRHGGERLWIRATRPNLDPRAALPRPSPYPPVYIYKD